MRVADETLVHVIPRHFRRIPAIGSVAPCRQHADRPSFETQRESPFGHDLSLPPCRPVALNPLVVLFFHHAGRGSGRGAGYDHLEFTAQIFRNKG